MTNPEFTLNRRTLIGAATAVAATGVLAQETQAQATPEASPEASPVASIVKPGPKIPPEIANAADTDWVTESCNILENRSVKGSSIDSGSVSNLAIAWTLEIEGTSPYGVLTSNPLVIGDRVYLQDANSNVYVIDKNTGEVIWNNTYNKQVPSGGPNGIGIGYGIMVYQVGNGGVVAADPETGKEIWHVDITGPKGEGVSMAPLLYDNKVWISTVPFNVSVLETFDLSGYRGMINVLDIQDGSVLWYWDTTTRNLWDQPATNAGGGAWHPPVVTSDGGVVWAIANIYPFAGTEDVPSTELHLGNNDYANSAVKLDPETGALQWAADITGRDIFDLDNHLIASGTVKFSDDYSREMIISTGKHGFVVGLDPFSGAQFFRTPVGTHRNDQLQSVPEGKTIEVWPGPTGGVETPFAYQDNTVYVACYENPGYFTNTGLGSATRTVKESSVIAAVDATDGTTKWSVRIPTGAFAGTTAVNDLVFTAALDGIVRAYSTKDGSLVWSQQVPAGVNGTLAVSGDYLFVPAGGPLIKSDDNQGDLPERVQQLIAFKLP